MKNLLLAFALLFSLGAVTFISCSKDDNGGGEQQSTDPNVLCNQGTCAGNDNLRDRCLDFYNNCLNNNTGSEAECATAAKAAICGP